MWLLTWAYTRWGKVLGGGGCAPTEGIEWLLIARGAALCSLHPPPLSSAAHAGERCPDPAAAERAHLGATDPGCQTTLDGSADPAEQVVSKETVRLAFVAALQRLTPRQRAALILRDVLQLSAAETAESARHHRGPGEQYAAACPRHGAAHRRGRPRPRAGPTRPCWRNTSPPSRHTTCSGYRAAAQRRGELDAAAAAVAGQDEIRPWMLGPGSGRGSRLLPTAANSCAAYAQYRRTAEAAITRGRYRCWRPMAA